MILEYASVIITITTAANPMTQRDTSIPLLRIERIFPFNPVYRTTSEVFGLVPIFDVITP
jgi:hypothetical protein